MLSMYKKVVIMALTQKTSVLHDFAIPGFTNDYSLNFAAKAIHCIVVNKSSLKMTKKMILRNAIQLIFIIFIAGCYPSFDPPIYYQMNRKIDVNGLVIDVTYNWHCYFRNELSEGDMTFKKNQYSSKSEDDFLFFKVGNDGLAWFDPPVCNGKNQDGMPVAGNTIYFIPSVNNLTTLEIFDKNKTTVFENKLEIKSEKITRLESPEKDSEQSLELNNLIRIFSEKKPAFGYVNAKVFSAKEWSKSESPVIFHEINEWTADVSLDFTKNKLYKYTGFMRNKELDISYKRISFAKKMNAWEVIDDKENSGTAAYLLSTGEIYADSKNSHYSGLVDKMVYQKIIYNGHEFSLSNSYSYPKITAFDPQNGEFVEFDVGSIPAVLQKIGDKPD